MTTCTLYDDPIPYNAPINYNGVCVTPPSGGGGGPLHGFEPTPWVAFPKKEEDEAVALILSQILVDED